MEVLIAASISGLLIAGAFYVFNVYDTSGDVSAYRAELEAEIRNDLAWIAKDVRQAKSSDISDDSSPGGNDPTSFHVKFRPAAGWDTVSSQLQLASYYIEYSADPVAKTFTRKKINVADSAVLATWNFNHIELDSAKPIFYTRDSGGNLVALSGNAGALRTSRKLIIKLTGQREVVLKGQQGAVVNLSCPFTQEVKIRNE